MYGTTNEPLTQDVTTFQNLFHRMTCQSGLNSRLRKLQPNLEYLPARLSVLKSGRFANIAVNLEPLSKRSDIYSPKSDFSGYRTYKIQSRRAGAVAHKRESSLDGPLGSIRRVVEDDLCAWALLVESPDRVCEVHEKPLLQMQ